MRDFSVRAAYPDELQTLIAIDDAATELYTDAGLKFEFQGDHPFVMAESRRWARAIESGLAFVAADPRDLAIGFATLGYVDGEPYLDQLAVLPRYMRRGAGSLLLSHAISWSGERPLWLTTYAHLPWNRPYYERHGFVTMPENECGGELRAILQAQRAALPDPEQRIAMVRRSSPVSG